MANALPFAQPAPDVDVDVILGRFGLTGPASGQVLRSPVTGKELGALELQGAAAVDDVATRAQAAFVALGALPMPARGDLVRRIGDAFRAHKETIAEVLMLEVGKIRSEAEGEIQEIIDICDFACGLSRTIGGHTLSSERAMHRLHERWHPLGPVLCISAFNFPAAVWGWNIALAIVCGDPVVWKPSLKATLTARACHQVARAVLEASGAPALADALQLLLVDDVVAASAVEDRRFALVSATGSTRMGQAVSAKVAARFGRCLLELGGNNAAVVLDDADLELALRAVVFGAFGTAGQRCTSTRRVLVQRGIADGFIERLVQAAQRLPIGSPFSEGTLVGPLIDADAGRAFLAALEEVRSHGGDVRCGGLVKTGEGPGLAPAQTTYPMPAVVVTPKTSPMLQREVFAPMLQVVVIDDLEEAIGLNNASHHGLSSAVFTRSLQAAERFVDGSDCGICNVNTGTSGAEIGGAFGGEKETGGGRESGSDAWKQYMRRQTSTVNYGDALPLAQGVRFDLG